MVDSTMDAVECGPARKTLDNLLGFFYPIHYRIGMELERRMCQGKISRQQATIIWLLASEVGRDGWMRRKQIEQSLSDWFETRNSHVSYLLRELSDPPLAFVVQKANPESGREKLVALTDQGRCFFDSMVEAALDYFSELLPHLSDDELRQGISFLGRAFGPPAVSAVVEPIV